MIVGTDRLLCRARKLQKDQIAIAALGGITVDGVGYGQSQVIADHTITPDDVCLRIVPAKHF